MKTEEGNKLLKYIKNLSRKEKYLLFISILIFTFIFIELVFVSPLNKKNYRYSQEVSELKGEKEKIVNTIRIKDELQEKLNKLNLIYNKKLVLFPKTEKQAEVLKSCIDFSKASGTSINEISFNDNCESSLTNKSNENDDKSEKIEDKDNIVTNSITVDLTGGFNNIMKFLEYIQKDKRSMDIENVQLSGDNDNSIKGVTDIRAVITVHYYNLNYLEKEKYYFNDGHYGKEDYFN